MPDRYLDRAVLILAAVFFAFMLYFGARYHWVEQLNSLEQDAYVDKAVAILDGQLPRDRYRPLGYPLMAAALSLVLGDTFAAARLVSQVAATLFVLLTFLVGKRLLGARAAFLAFAAMLPNYWVITEGVHVTTDMTFAALTMLALYCGLLLLERPRWSLVVALGATFGLAGFVRYPGSALLPSALLAVCVAYRRQGRTRRPPWAALALFALAALITLLPHFVITARLFGHPFYQENWRNVAFKLYGEGDWTYLGSTEFTGFLDVVLRAPGYFVRAGAREALSFAREYLGILVAPDLAWGRALASVAVALGLIPFLSAMDAQRWTVVAFAVIYSGLVFLTFFPWPRVMLPLLPLCYWLLASLAQALGRWARRLGVRRPDLLAFPLLATVVVLQLLGLRRDLGAFAEQHPIPEVEACRELEERFGSQITVLGTFRFMRRYVGYRYLEAPRIGTTEDPGPYYATLRRYAERVGADYVVVGRRTLADRPADLLSWERLPVFLAPLWRTSDVAVYRLDLDGTP